MTASITIVGLGPGRWADVTLEARALLEQAEREQQPVHFRTLIHPTVAPLRQQLPGLEIQSFDSLYDEAGNWETLYQQIAEQLCALAAARPIIYAVPGHPIIGETSVQRVLALSKEQGLTTRIVAGLSFLEPVCAALQLDPLACGIQILDATALAALDPSELAGKVIPTIPLLVAQVYNRRIAGAVKLALSELYADEWRVKLVRAADSEAEAAAGGEKSETVIELPLYELDRNRLANHLCTLYVPPVDALTALRLPETLRYITMRLRREPDGCPWDRELTHESLTRYVIEETYEVVEALEENDMDKLAEELGDLLLQVYLHAEIGRQQGEFAIEDIFEHISAKLIRRHPHVFGQVEVSGSGQVLQNWEAIKKQERIAAGIDVQQESVLDRVPQAAPALSITQEYLKRVTRAGFAFENLQEVLAKLSEELQEVQQATTPEHCLEEMGDVLFMVAEVARFLHIDAEHALRSANRKFRRRFQAMEQLARQEARSLNSYSIAEWLAMWKKVKSY